jgi:RNA polymerase sigma-70 factor, ECF subfamily
VEAALTAVSGEAKADTCETMPEDFEVLVREHQKRIYRILFSLLHDADEADCLTQECFLRAFRKRASFRGEASLGTWLTRIAINLARDRARNRRLAFWKRKVPDFQAAAETICDPYQSPEGRFLAQEQVAIIWSAVKDLPEKRRTAFVLRYAEEMPLEEIAAVMNLETGTVKTHLWHATQAVRRHLGRRS